LFGVATTARGDSGQGFILGTANTADNPTSLSATLQRAVQSALTVINKSGGPALDLRVGNPNANPPISPNDVAPMKVNSNKVVSNLNADQLDGNNSTAFLSSEIYKKSKTQTIPPDNVDNGITLYCDSRDVAVSGSYRISKPGAYLQVFGEERVDERFDAETGRTSPSAWHVYVDNPDTTTSGTITVFVYCADRPPLHISSDP